MIDVRQLEQALAQMSAHERRRLDAELAVLRQQLAAVEKDLAIATRLAAIEEKLAGADEVKPPNIARLRPAG